MKRSHALLMLLCCLAPLAAFVSIALLRLPVNTVMLAGMMLLCPFSHVLRMARMRHEAGDLRPNGHG